MVRTRICPPLAVALAVFLLGTFALSQSGQPGEAGEKSGLPAAWPQNQAAPSEAASCIPCHRSEVEGFARSAMARSLRPAGHEPEGKVETPDTKITMEWSPDGYFQRLESGAETARYRIDYVVGSGNHASGYLLEVSDHLFQSPVAYYKSRQAYDLAPGFEGRPNPDFTRPVGEGCLFCHAGTALPIAGTANRYRSPPFLAEGITCERCHGSAEKHLAAPRGGTIVNPAKLEPAARDSICEQCHLLGAAKVLSPGREFSDFRPGQRLEEVFTTYCNAAPGGSGDGKFKVISHVEQLARSTCARSSGGKLWCGTCHDPHNAPAEPVAFFRSKCLSCHAANFPAAHPARDSNCIGCHMPRRDAKDGGHTAFTDHRIERRPQPQPELAGDLELAAWRKPAPDLEKRNLGIAYINAGMESRSMPWLVRGYRLLTEVQDQFSSDADLFRALGNALLLAKEAPEAEIAFDRVLQLDPGSATGESNAASAYFNAGDADGAVRHLERAVALDPLQLSAVAPLIRLYRQRGSPEKAAELSARVTAAMDTGTQSASGGNPRPAPDRAAPLTEAVFKNIQVLKGVPSDQLIPAMRFMSASLGVECSYCHVPEHFDKDDKKPKQIARDMMRMMLAIDKNSFEGNQEVTCYSCHRGAPTPEAIPTVRAEGEAKPALAQAAGAEAEKLPANLPTAAELVGRYVEALGGAAALEGLNSRAGKGTSTIEGRPVAVEVFNQGPDKLAMIRHLGEGDAITAFDGKDGWTSLPGRPLREMHGADLDSARMDADLQFPLHIRQVFDRLRVEYPEKIGDQPAYVLSGLRGGAPAVKFYFDEQSGLLLRLVRYAESPLGLDPTEIDYGDYRDAGGAKAPFRWTIARPGERSTIQFDRIEDNVAIDGLKFTRPAPAAGAPRR